MNKNLLTAVIMTIITAIALPSCSSSTTEEDVVPPQQTQTPAIEPMDEITYGDNTYNNGIVSLSQAGTMINLLGEKYLEISFLKIIGPINSSDIYYLREMCSELGKLRNLDMEDATIIEGGFPYLNDKITSNYSLGAEMFYGCHLKSITLPKNIYIIEDNAFKDCKELTTVHILEECKLTSIENYAFCGCAALAYLPFPNKLKSIGNYAFAGCSSITNIKLSETITSIGNGAFKGCERFSYITIPGNISCIGDSTFYACRNIKKLIIDEGITSIGEYAFADCGRIDTIIIPNSLDTIKADAFYHSSGKLYTEFETWQNINLLSYRSSPINDSHEGGRYAGSIHFISNGEEIKELVIPESTTQIRKQAFLRCALTSINIPESVTSIGHSAFYECYNLKSINIPESVTSIEYRTFESCSSLTSINIPGTVNVIGEYAFRNCSNLETIIIQDGVESIEYAAFSECDAVKKINIPGSVRHVNSPFYSCDNLKSIIIQDGIKADISSLLNSCHLTDITFYSTTPPTGVAKLISMLKEPIQIIVPKGCYSDYAKLLTNYNGVEIIEMDS